MTEEIKQKLRDAGREDLIKIHEINQSGYAGVLPNGNIVDRREHPNAVPVQKNSLFNIPLPKKLTQDDQLLWWGYTHTNGSVQAKRYWDDKDRKDAKSSPFVITVYGPFPSKDRDEAIDFIKRLSKR